MYFCTARVMRKAPLRCTFMTMSQSVSDILNSMLSRVTPALFTRTTGAPSSSATRDEPAACREEPHQRHARAALPSFVALEADVERGVHEHCAHGDTGGPRRGEQRCPVLRRGVRVVHDHAAALGQQLGDDAPLA